MLKFDAGIVLSSNPKIGKSAFGDGTKISLA
jgi:hypothetical protein